MVCSVSGSAENHAENFSYVWYLIFQWLQNCLQSVISFTFIHSYINSTNDAGFIWFLGDLSNSWVQVLRHSMCYEVTVWRHMPCYVSVSMSWVLETGTSLTSWLIWKQEKWLALTLDMLLVQPHRSDTEF